jgi:hypothetical protein
MPRTVWRLTFLSLFTCAIGSLAAETLGDVLRAAKIPTQQVAASELAGKITSYAASDGDPFLLAYYVDNGSGLLGSALQVMRYGRSTGSFRSAAVRETDTPIQSELPMEVCLGSALDIREYRDVVYIDMHLSPSAGCVLVLSPRLELKAALSGWLLGLIGSEYAILQRSEIHFASVHPMRVAIYDLRRNRSTVVYPYPGDPQRRQFSRWLKPHISEQWCLENNAQCDPENFDTELVGNVIVNEAGKVFGFRAQFEAGGFGAAAEKQVPDRTVGYIFRERGGRWEHREFDAWQFQRLPGGMSFDELITQKPDLAFRVPAAK